MGIVKASDEAIAAAAAHLRAGRLVAFPTETVYGLGADATNGEAVAAIFATKGRPRFNPLIVHVADVGQAGEHAQLTALARQLIDAFWPGPLTLVLEKRAAIAVSDLVTGGLTTIAVRSPDHPVARALLACDRASARGAVGQPLGPHQPDAGGACLTDLGDDVAMILDGGPTAHGLEFDRRRRARRRAGAVAPGRRHGGDDRGRARLSRWCAQRSMSIGRMRPASSPATTRPMRGCGSTPWTCGRRSAAGVRRQCAGHRRASHQSQPIGRPDGSGGQPVRGLAGARCRAAPRLSL